MKGKAGAMAQKHEKASQELKGVQYDVAWGGMENRQVSCWREL
jgi:hypothetical protein